MLRSAQQRRAIDIGLLYQLDRHWGLYGYAKYERLIADAADSPIVRTIGSRNQFSGGVALTFTFDTGIRR